MRASLFTAPSFTGTLRSSRISTRLPWRSRSVIFKTVMLVFLKVEKQRCSKRVPLRAMGHAQVMVGDVEHAVGEPHSLSNQASRFTRRGPEAQVRLPSTIAECGSWLKSQLACGNSV